jgi:hypothetical protein
LVIIRVPGCTVPVDTTAEPVPLTLPERVMVLLTITVRVTEPVLPAASIREYVRKYVPAIEVFTDPLVAARIVPGASTLSV